MKTACFLVLGVLLFVGTSNAESLDYIQVTGNPFMTKAPPPAGTEGTCSSSDSACALQVVDPSQVIVTPMATQEDTLMGIVQRKYMGMVRATGAACNR